VSSHGRPADADADSRARGARRPAPLRSPAGRLAALGAGFAAVAALVYAPSFPGGFISDDILYVGLNPYVQSMTLANALAILDPFGELALMSANWAPVHLFAHMLEWRVFGVEVAAWHLTNALLHALVSALFVALLVRTGVPERAAAVAGAFFLLHPANVEAVAWISQLKTILATGFALAALLLRPTRPGLATAAFVLGLLSKSVAAAALPAAWALDRAHAAAPGPDAAGRARRGSLRLWAAALAGFAVVQLAAFLYQHPGGGAVERTLAERAVLSAAVGMRYLVMAATGWGVSTFHEPALEALAPWAAGGVAAGALLAARAAVALRRRRAEAAWWLLAAASWAPVSQAFPFLYPMADRYLYAILPGLLGGALLAGRELLAGAPPRARRAAAAALAAAAAAACLHFAATSRARAGLWVSDARVMADAVRHYPEGTMAHYVRARGAARDRDAERAAAELRLAARNPAFGFQHVRTDPKLDPIRKTAAFRALLEELAREHVARSGDEGRMAETDLISLAQAQLTVDDPGGALATLERALARGGAYRGVALALRRQARALVEARAAAAGAAPTEEPPGAASPGPAGATAPHGPSAAPAVTIGPRAREAR